MHALVIMRPVFECIARAMLRALNPKHPGDDCPEADKCQEVILRMSGELRQPLREGLDSVKVRGAGGACCKTAGLRITTSIGSGMPASPTCRCALTIYRCAAATRRWTQSSRSG